MSEFTRGQKKQTTLRTLAFSPVCMYVCALCSIFYQAMIILYL